MSSPMNNCSGKYLYQYLERSVKKPPTQPLIKKHMTSDHNNVLCNPEKMNNLKQNGQLKEEYYEKIIEVDSSCQMFLSEEFKKFILEVDKPLPSPYNGDKPDQTKGKINIEEWNYKFVKLLLKIDPSYYTIPVPSSSNKIKPPPRRDIQSCSKNVDCNPDKEKVLKKKPKKMNKHLREWKRQKEEAVAIRQMFEYELSKVHLPCSLDSYRPPPTSYSSMWLLINPTPVEEETWLKPPVALPIYVPELPGFWDFLGENAEFIKKL